MKIIVLLACLLVSGPADAYTVRGPGYSLCSEYLATQRGTPLRDQFNAWILGFISGLEAHALPAADAGTQDQANNNQVLQAFWNMCRKDHTKNLANVGETVSNWMVQHAVPATDSNEQQF